MFVMVYNVFVVCVCVCTPSLIIMIITVIPVCDESVDACITNGFN